MTEPAPTFAAPYASNMAGTTPQPTSAENNTGAQAGATEQDVRLTNGKTPDDIPDADNDSVFEAQIGRRQWQKPTRTQKEFVE